MSAGPLPDGRVAVVLGAHAEELVCGDAAAILDYARRTQCEPVEVAAQLIATRRLRRHRVLVRAGDRIELAAGLSAVAHGEEHPLVSRSARRTGGRTAFVFPGQGGQWASMGAEAYERLPRYRAEADRLDVAIRAAGLPSPLGFLTVGSGSQAVSHVELQAAQFVHSVGLAAVWRACGIVPDLVLGHSLGEVAAAYVAGTLTLADAVAVIAARAAAIESIPGEHGVAVLGVDAGRAAALIEATSGWLEISAVNASASVAVSGERAAVRSVVETVRSGGQFARELAMSFPAHTTLMDATRTDVTDALARLRFADSPVQFIGSATGDVVGSEVDFASYWYANLRNTIRFDRAVRTAIALQADVFIEMSAHPSLLFAIEDGIEHAGGVEAAVLVGSGHRDRSLVDTVAENIAAAAIGDSGYRWGDLLPGWTPPLPGFPGAPMRTEHLWAAPEPLPAADRLTVTTETWLPHDVPPRVSRTHRVAVVDLRPAVTSSMPLREAIASHPATVLADAADAEIILAVVSEPGSLAVDDVITGLAADLDARILDYADVAGPRCRAVWLVTAGAETILDDDPVADLAGAALAAMHRCVGFEYPDQDFGHLDLPADSGSDVLGTAIDAMLGGGGELAIRGDAMLYRRTLADDTPQAAPWPAGVLDNVVITGGSGAIGMSFARYLAAHGAKRIVLLSRGGVDPALRDDLGIDVVAPPCDLRDVDDIASAAADFADGEATLIIHAAGIAAFADHTTLTGSDFAAMAAAKIVGLESLTRVWPMRADARILLCSSVTGVWGGKGVAGYAATNRMLDVMAARLRGQGRRCTAVRWGLWEGSGIVDAAEIARVERAGLRPMNPQLAVEAGIGDWGRDPLVLSADVDRLHVLFGDDGPPRRTVGTGGAQVHPAEAGAAAPPDTLTAVRSQLAVVLDVDAASLDLDSSLFDLGVDSLLALDLRKRLKRLTGHTVALAALLGGITGTDLIAELTEKVNYPRD